MLSMKCDKKINVCLFNCNIVPYIVVAVMCIYVIYNCLSRDFDQQQDLGKPG
jgi:hypothetical protein